MRGVAYSRRERAEQPARRAQRALAPRGAAARRPLIGAARYARCFDYHTRRRAHGTVKRRSRRSAVMSSVERITEWR